MTRDVNRRTYLKAAGAASVFGMAGCLGDDDGEMPGLTTAYVVPAGNKPSLFRIDDLREEVADNAGEEYELTVDSIGSTPDHVNAVASGDVQVAMSTIGSMPSAIINEAVEGGVTAVAVDYVDGHEDYHSIGGWAAEDSGIEETADLEGGTIGVNALGTGVHAIAVGALAANDLSEDDVEFQEFGFGQMQSAIDEGQVDAGVVPSTFAGAMELEGGYQQVFDSREAFGTSYPFTYLFASNDYIDENEETLEYFLEDYASLVDYILDEDNRDDVIDMIVEEFDAPREIYDHVLYTENDYYHPNPPELDGDGLQTVVDALAEMGFLDEQVDMGPHVDNSYLP